jgi:hypothetical protein
MFDLDFNLRAEIAQTYLPFETSAEHKYVLQEFQVTFGVGQSKLSISTST